MALNPDKGKNSEKIELPRLYTKYFEKEKNVNNKKS